MRAPYVDLLGKSVLWALCLMGVASTGPGAVRADEDRLVLMREPAPYTDVIDAAEQHDRFDLNAHLSYVRSVGRGVIQREHTENGQARRSAVADSEHKRSQLMLGIDVGVFLDVMAFLRVPLVLSDERTLSALGGQRGERAAGLLIDPGDVTSRDGSLFSLPLGSPARAGFDYVALGGAMAITSQERQAWLPTWVVMLEGRRAVGALMRPCKRDAENNPRCGADAGEEASADSTASLPDSSGVSRGVSAFSLETRVSKRYRYFEPYAGLSALVEWASTARSYFLPGGDLKGYVQHAPGRQLTATLGSEFMPWEHKGRFQRIAVDARLSATYFTRGRDYSVLYDALGTSGHVGLARPNYEGGLSLDPSIGAPSVCTDPKDSNCYVGKKVPFYGLTDIGGRIRYGGRMGLEIRAARYVRFAFGTGLHWITAHTLTGADACNVGEKSAARSSSSSGFSCGAHASNPAHRPTIDLPGRRFWMTSELVFEVYAAATAQF